MEFFREGKSIVEWNDCSRRPKTPTQGRKHVRKLRLVEKRRRARTDLAPCGPSVDCPTLPLADSSGTASSPPKPRRLSDCRESHLNHPHRKANPRQNHSQPMSEGRKEGKAGRTRNTNHHSPISSLITLSKPRNQHSRGVVNVNSRVVADLCRTRKLSGDACCYARSEDLGCEMKEKLIEGEVSRKDEVGSGR